MVKEKPKEKGEVILQNSQTTEHKPVYAPS
jgi:hypothetical protein